MKKIMMTSLMVVAVLVLGNVAFAWWGGPGMGYGPGGYGKEVKTESVIKFHKETLAMRDELMTKQLELRDEYDKQTLDTSRINTLKKEILDIQAKIQVAADKHGLPGPMKAGKGQGRMGRGMGAGYGACPGPGW